jgi:DNA repair protein SbcC/Rad50
LQRERKRNPGTGNQSIQDGEIMFLKEYALRRYGPLPDSGKRVLGNFNLFFGPNEDGKTLTIDALLKILFGKAAARSFQAVKRVDEYPDGYAVISFESRQEIKLPEGGLLPDILNLGAAEFTNTFIIRDSNLSIANEDHFYRGVTSRLTGMRTGEIGQIISELQELGSVTTSGEFKNTSPVKLKDRVNKAVRLLEKCNELRNLMTTEGYNSMEQELALLREKQNLEQEKLKQMRAAANRSKYEKGLVSMQKLETAREEIKKLKTITEREYNLWRNAMVSLEHFQLEQERIQGELETEKDKLDKAQANVQIRRATSRGIENEREELYLKVKPLLDQVDKKEQLFSKWELLKTSSMTKGAVIFTITVFLLSLAGSIFNPSGWLFAMLGFTSLLMVAIAVFLLFYLNSKGRLNILQQELLAEAERMNLDAKDTHQIRKKMGQLDQAFNQEKELFYETEKNLEWRQNIVKRLKEDLLERESQVKECINKIRDIQGVVGVDDLDQFESLLKCRQDLREEIEKQVGILDSHFETNKGSSSMDERVDYWNEQIQIFSRYASAAPGVNYDQHQVSTLNAALADRENEINRVQELLKERNNELLLIEKDLNDLFSIEGQERLVCQTTVDLEVIINKLESWIKTKEETRRAALTALTVFETIDREEEQKVSSLFEAESPVSNYFQLITEGRYRAVRFDPEENKVKIRDSNGLELDAEQLSGGAYDQLYFAIRLALGEKLLDGEKGFFILDDPFIKADSSRLEILLAMLYKICENGWQILYFSSKGEVRQALEKKIATGEVKELTVKT